MKAEQLRLLTALTEIYELTNEKETQVSILKVLKDNNVKYAQKVSETIKKENLVSVSKGKGITHVVKWNTIKPNIKMVEKIIEVSTKVEEKPTVTMTDNERNMLNALNEIYELTKKDYVRISKDYILKKHGVKNKSNVSKSLNDLNLLQKDGYNQKWISEKPNLKTVEKINKNIIDISKKYQDKINNPKPTPTNPTKPETPKKYKKEFKIFGLTIYSTTTTQL